MDITSNMLGNTAKNKLHEKLFCNNKYSPPLQWKLCCKTQGKDQRSPARETAKKVRLEQQTDLNNLCCSQLQHCTLASMNEVQSINTQSIFAKG